MKELIHLVAGMAFRLGLLDVPSYSKLRLRILQEDIQKKLSQKSLSAEELKNLLLNLKEVSEQLLQLM